MSVKVLIVFILSLTSIDANDRVCPRCRDAYNPASCTETQKCDDDRMCVLHLHVRDTTRVEYTCSSTQTCRDNCGSITQGTCSYCCPSVSACSNHLTELIAHASTPQYLSTAGITRTPSIQLTTNSAHTVGHSILTTTAAAAATTPPQTAATTPPQTAATTPPQTTHPAHLVHTCVQCGDFGFDRPCTAIELLLNEPTACLDGLPYCYESIKVTAGVVKVSKGCSEHNFCRVEWDFGHSSGCYPEDFSKDLSCTYCCKGNACNSVTPPVIESLVTFP